MEMLRWKIFDFAPTSLTLCYHRASPASFCCSCAFLSLPYPLVPFSCRFLRRSAILTGGFVVEFLGLFISFRVGVQLLYIVDCVYVANVALAVASCARAAALAVASRAAAFHFRSSGGGLVR